MIPRVLFLNHSAVLGGGELHLLDLMRRFRSRGTVLLLSDGPLLDRLRSEGVDVDVLQAGKAMLSVRREDARPGLEAVVAVVSLARRVARRAAGYEVLFANSQKAFVVAALAARFARRPLVWHLQDLLTPEHFSPLNIRLVVRLANLLAARVVANSRATADAFAAAGGDAAKVRVVYNGFEPPRAPATCPSAAAEVRAELGLGDAPLLGVFSRFHPWKGQHVVVEAMRSLPGVHALMVGEPLFGELEYFQATQERVRTLGLADRVHFLGFRPDVDRLMRAADVVVHPSVAPEPFGRVVVEGMLAGRPVVASRAGGVLEIVEDGVTGVLVPPGDPQALASALSALFASPSRRASLGRAGLAHAASTFTHEVSFAGVCHVLAEVVRR